MTAAQALRISERGPLRTVVEATFVCGASALVRQYVVDHAGGLEIRDRVFNNHRDAMLKLLVPLAFEAAESLSEALTSEVSDAK